MNNKQPTVTIIILGESRVGKSALIRRFSIDEYTPEFYTTLGMDFVTKEVADENNNISAQIWDTAGQERFMTMTKSFYKRSDGILLVYDISSKKSFMRLNNWIENIKCDASARIPKYLVGNKVDLREERDVTTEEGKLFATEHNMNFFETSAKTSINVTEAFESIIKEAYKKKQERIMNPSIVLKASEVHSKSNKRCCK
jgi:Ras-related protein Rab-1A